MFGINHQDLIDFYGHLKKALNIEVVNKRLRTVRLQSKGCTNYHELASDFCNKRTATMASEKIFSAHKVTTVKNYCAFSNSFDRQFAHKIKIKIAT